MNNFEDLCHTFFGSISSEQCKKILDIFNVRQALYFASINFSLFVKAVCSDNERKKDKVKK